MNEIQKLASLIAKREGKKSEARIGDIREVLGILADLSFEGAIAPKLLYEAGARRAKARHKRK